MIASDIRRIVVSSDRELVAAPVVTEYADEPVGEKWTSHWVGEPIAQV